MSGALSSFHFLRPWWLLAALAIPLIWRMLARRGADAGAWSGAVDAHLLEHLLVRGDESAPRRWPMLLLVAGWLIACLALAGPAWEQLPTPLYRNTIARVFALELSASMLAQDEKPSRYERARFKLKDLLAQSADAQTALIAFAGDAFVVAPLTDDANTVANLVDALDPGVMPVAGNATGRAIDLAIDLVKQGGGNNGEIVLLADAAGDDALAAAARARAAGMRLTVVAFGSAQGAPVPLPQGGFLKNAAGEIVLPKVDAQALAALAAAGGGRFLDDSSEVGALGAQLGAPVAADASHASAEAGAARFLDRGPWLLLLLVPLAALGFRRGWLMLVLAGVFAGSQPARAFSWTDLWQRADQQARAQLDAGNAQQAQALAQSPDLRAAAAYRAGDYKAAEANFNRGGGADAQYNRGNALAKQGRFEEAIKAYDAALQAAPKMADAEANKHAVEEWLKQQKQKDSSESKKDSKDHQGHQQNQDGQGSPSQQQDQQSQDDQQQNQSSPQSKNSESQKQQQQQGGAGDDNDKQTAQAQPSAEEAEKQAQQKFSEKMDKAVQDQAGKGDKKPQPMRLGANDDGRQRDEHEQAIEQWIERVPDDPGGLLRRKFQLEYQRRQNRADPRGGGE